MIDLYIIPLPMIFIGSLLLIWGATEVGWRLGTRSQAESTNIGTLESATIGLLALLVGFTFAMALARFEARRDAVVQEANAIGTTVLRARFLPEPYRAESLKLLRDYVQVRIDAFQSGQSFAEMKAAVERSNVIQQALWQQAMAVGEKDKALIPTGLFIQSLNQMFDSQGVRLAVLRNQIPSIVLIVLNVLAAAAGGFVGYASAIDARLSRLPAIIMGLLISLVLYLIADLDRPNSGFITNNQQAMLDVAESIKGLAD
jgi:cellobiose-specific phosphotransferase system component IIC